MPPRTPIVAIALLAAAWCAPAAAGPWDDGDGAWGGWYEEPASFRIVFDGQTLGLSSGRMELGYGDLVFAFLQERGGHLVAVESSLGLLYREGRYVWTDDGLLSSAIAFLDGGGFEVLRRVGPTPVLRTQQAVLLQGVDDAEDDLLDFLDRELRARHEYGQPVRLRGVLVRYRNADGAEAWVVQGPGTPPLSALVADPTRWEVRPRETVRVEVDGEPRTLHQLPRVVGEGSRRKALVESLLGDGLDDPYSPALYVSAGGAVEGRSFVEGQELSLMRPLSWDAYGRTGLRLLAPTRTELLGGLDRLTREADGAGVTVLAANLRDAGGEHPFAGAELVTIGPARVAFVGVVDPAVAEGLRASVRAELMFEDPAPSVTRALAALREEHGAAPDLTVLLAGFEPAALGELVREVSDVDVVLGDFSASAPSSQQVDVTPSQLRALADAEDRRPLLVVHAGGAEVGEIEGQILGGELVSLQLRTHPVTQLTPADAEALSAVMAIRQQVYLAAEDVLVPDLRTLVAEDPARLSVLLEGQPHRAMLEREMEAGTLTAERLPLRMTPNHWSNLAANLLRERSGADVVVLPPLPWPFQLTGPTRSLYAHAYLAVPDELRLYELSGAQLRELLRITGDARNDGGDARNGGSAQGDRDAEARRGAPWVAGLDPAHGKVGGRPLSGGEVYRVLTTSALVRDPRVVNVLAGARARTRFVPTRRGFRASARGEEATLRAQVRGGLEQARAADPAFGPAYRARLTELLADRGDALWPMFYARADNLGLTFTRYLVSGDQDAYANVRESRVTTPASFTFGLRADGTIGVDTRDVALESRLQATLSVNTVGDAEPTELEDDLQLSMDLGLKALSDRTVPIYPYLQAAYDTEFLRADELGDDGEVIGLQPRQQDLRGTAGAKASNLLPSLTSLKGGAFVEYDFAADEGPFEAGMTLEVRQELTRKPLKWANTLVLYGWFPTPADTDEDLLFSLDLRSELGVLIFGNLQLKVYADLLAYRGKVEATDAPGLSTILGVELAYSGRVQRRLFPRR